MAAPNSTAALKNIESLLAQAEYQKAKEQITSFLAQGEHPSGLLSKLHWLKGICLISQGKDALAKSSFLSVLSAKPDFAPDKNTSPKVLKVFKETEEIFKKQHLTPLLETSFSPIEKILAGEKYTFQVKILTQSGSKKIGRLKFYLRQLGNSDYSTLDFKPLKEDPSIYEVEIPQFLTSRFENDAIFEYFVEITAASKEIIGNIGSKVLPLSFEVCVNKEPPSFDNQSSSSQIIVTAVWVSAAALAVASVATLAYVFSSADSGNLRVRVYPAE